MKNDVIYAAVCALLLVVRAASREQMIRLGRRLGSFAHAFARRARARARRNVAMAFPRASAKEAAAVAHAAFVNLGGHLAEVVATLRHPVPLLTFDEPSRQVLADALAEGRGVVLPSAHLGPWDRLAATLAAAFPMTAIVRESYDPRLDAIVTRARTRVGFATIGRGSPGAATRIVRTLRAGQVLGIPMDVRTRAASVSVPFLGADAPTAVGPARLALRTGAPVVVSTIDPAQRVTCTRIKTRDLGEGADVELTRGSTPSLGAEYGPVPSTGLGCTNDATLTGNMVQPSWQAFMDRFTKLKSTWPARAWSWIAGSCASPPRSAWRSKRKRAPPPSKRCRSSSHPRPSRERRRSSGAWRSGPAASGWGSSSSLRETIARSFRSASGGRGETG